MESDDGIQWNRPVRILDAPPGFIGSIESVIDEGPRSADLSKRFKTGWYEWKSGTIHGMRIATSPDGLTWT
jgi:hypothetical protein